MQNAQERWIFISPHLDDAILSCGGLIWELVQMGQQVEIWTLFAGDPPSGALTLFAESLHARWGTRPEDAIRIRREEDIEACRMLGAAHRHFSFLDCIYRRFDDSGQPVVQGEEDLFQRGYMKEKPLSALLSDVYAASFTGEDTLVAPFGIGGHIDHQLAHSALEGFRGQTWFYADYPYAGTSSIEVRAWHHRAGRSFLGPVSCEGLVKWQDAVGAYTSQISTFWQGFQQMKQALRTYWAAGGGSLLRRF